MKKSEVILHIYHRLLVNKSIYKKEITDKFDLSGLRFARYIAEIRSFLVKENLSYQLIYERKTDKYSLVRIR
jgi:hypothetical protein